MAVPDFQSIMLPMLKLLGDKKERRVGEIVKPPKLGPVTFRVFLL